jgi:hypothetical protein
MKRQLNAGATLVVASGLIAAGVLAAVRPAAEPAEKAPERIAAEPQGARGGLDAAVPGRAGLRVHLDPETGQMRNRPTDPESYDHSQDPGDRLNTYGGDLLQEALPHGGFKVDLRGRFQSAVVATIDPDTDEVRIDCIAAPTSEKAGDER